MAIQVIGHFSWFLLSLYFKSVKMANMTPEEFIINFVNDVWEVLFPKHRVAPKTLLYDPLLTMPLLTSGLCFLAHNGNYMSYYAFHNGSPDEQVLSISDNSLKFSCCSNKADVLDISHLPIVECLLFISNSNRAHFQIVLEKLASKGVAIVLNDCISLPKAWIPLAIPYQEQDGASQKVKSLEAFIKE